MKSFHRLSSLLWRVLLACGTLFILIYIGVALARMRYPYHLEWMEGGSLSQVQWVLRGRSLYVRPSFDFAAITYTPLYFYVSAAAAALLGSGFFPLRLVSFLSSLGCFGLLFLLVRRETSHASTGLLAASLFAATYRVSGGWFDLARVDSLFLLLLLASIYLVRCGRSHASAIVAGVLLTLSYLTKQSALPLAFPLLLWSLIERPRWSWRFAASFAVTSAGSFLLLDGMNGGWFRFYTFVLPFEIPMVPFSILKFLGHDILAPLGIAVGLGVVYLLYLIRQGAGTRPTVLFYSLLGLSALAVSYLTRKKAGAFLNDLIPAYAFIAILFALAVDFLRQRWRTPDDAATPAGPHRLPWVVLEVALPALCILQFALLSYDPRGHLPSRLDRRAGDQIVSWIRSFDGEVFAPEFGYLASFAGKREYINFIALLPVMRCHDERLSREVMEEMRAAVRGNRFSACVFALPYWAEEDLLGSALKDYAGTRILYPLSAGLDAREYHRRGTRWIMGTDMGALAKTRESDTFLPMTGYPMRPILLYTLRQPQAPSRRGV